MNGGTTLVPPFRFFTERVKLERVFLQQFTSPDRSVIDRYAERLAQVLASDSAVPYRNRRVSDDPVAFCSSFLLARHGPVRADWSAASALLFGK